MLPKTSIYKTQWKSNMQISFQSLMNARLKNPKFNILYLLKWHLSSFPSKPPEIISKAYYDHHQNSSSKHFPLTDLSKILQTTGHNVLGAILTKRKSFSSFFCLSSTSSLKKSSHWLIGVLQGLASAWRLGHSQPNSPPPPLWPRGFTSHSCSNTLQSVSVHTGCVVCLEPSAWLSSHQEFLFTLWAPSNHKASAISLRDILLTSYIYLQCLTNLQLLTYKDLSSIHLP